jgi:hypothetical protein
LHENSAAACSLLDTWCAQGDGLDSCELLRDHCCDSLVLSSEMLNRGDLMQTSTLMGELKLLVDWDGVT